MSNPKKDFENGLKRIEEFEKQKTPLLTDLTNLIDELEDQTNPLLKQSEVKLDTLQCSISNLTGDHKQRM